MANLDDVWNKPGRRANTLKMRMPRQPELVLQIIDMKDGGTSFRKIAEVIDRSHQAAFLLYHRWREWAYAQKEIGNGET